MAHAKLCKGKVSDETSMHPVAFETIIGLSRFALRAILIAMAGPHPGHNLCPGANPSSRVSSLRLSTIYSLTPTYVTGVLTSPVLAVSRAFSSSSMRSFTEMSLPPIPRTALETFVSLPA